MSSGAAVGGRSPLGGEYMAYGDGDRGVGGWLAFFLITLGVITPGASIIVTLLSFNDPDTLLAYEMYPSLVWTQIAMTTVLMAACWFACWRFLKVFNRATVRIGIGTVLFLTLLSILVEPMVVSAITGIRFGEIAGAMGPELFRPIVYAAIWTTYLLVSKRVQNTYSGLRSEEELSEVFQ